MVNRMTSSLSKHAYMEFKVAESAPYQLRWVKLEVREKIASHKYKKMNPGFNSHITLKEVKIQF